jgi:hypothetical protein
MVTDETYLQAEMIWKLNRSIFRQVKNHSFFRDINWETLARQKVVSVLFFKYLEVMFFFFLIVVIIISEHLVSSLILSRLCSFHREKHMTRVIFWAVIYGIQKVKMFMEAVTLRTWQTHAAVVHSAIHMMTM